MTKTTTLSIYQRKSGLYASAIRLPTGRRKDVYGRSEQEVREKVAAILHQTGSLGYLESITTVAGWLEQWLRDVEGTVDSTTYQSYTWAVHKHLIPRLGTVTLAGMTYGVVNHLMDEVAGDGYAPTTQRYLRRILRQAMRRAERLGLVDENVVHDSKTPAEGEEPEELNVLLPDEIRRLFETLREDASDGRNTAPKDGLLALMLATGLRRGETLGMAWKDVDLDHGFIKVRQQLIRHPDGTSTIKSLKTRSSRRTLPIPPLVISMLRVEQDRQWGRHRRGVRGLGDELGLVFTNAEGNPWDPNHIRRWFRRLCSRTGIPERTLHDIRHTALTLIATTSGIETAQKIAGHKHVSTTADVYHHLIPQTAAAIANHMQSILMIVEEG